MLERTRHAIRCIPHFVWIQFQESGAMLAGQRITLDARYTGDRFAPSPLVEEEVISIDETVTETREIHRKEHV